MYQIIDTQQQQLLVWSRREDAPPPFPGAIMLRSLPDVAKAAAPTTSEDDFASDYAKQLSNNRPQADNVNILDKPFVQAAGGDKMQGYSTPLQFVKSKNFWLDKTRNIATGSILWVHEPKTGTRYVIKHQKVDAVDIDFVVTPGPCAAELRALLHFRSLMAASKIIPAFCDLTDHSTFYGPQGIQLSTTMKALTIDMIQWLVGSLERPSSRCLEKPHINMSADYNSSWVYCPSAGVALAMSSHVTDVKLFNDILRGSLLQVFIGLAQAQRNLLFVHCDLHAANVMFDASQLGKTRMFCMGAGAFLLPKHVPGAKIIDFQHAAFDDYDSRGVCIGRVVGSGGEPNEPKNGPFNSFNLSYDTQRLCGFIASLLKPPIRARVEPDLMRFLWRCAQFPGDSAIDAHPKFDREVTWFPCLLHGLCPEEALADEVFDCYRCSMDAFADVIFYEKQPSADAQERFLRNRALHNFNLVPADRESVLNAFAFPERYIQNGVQQALHVFALNFSNTMMNKATLMVKHTVAARARFLYMEFILLNTMMDHFFGPDCHVEVHKRMFLEDKPLHICSLADAIGVVVHSNWNYLGRPDREDLRVYHVRVKKDIDLACVRSVAMAPSTHPRVSASEEKSLLTINEEAHLEKFRAVMYNVVMSS